MCWFYRGIYIWHGYSSILPHVKLTWYTTMLYDCMQLPRWRVTSDMGTCASCDIGQWNCVVQLSPMDFISCDMYMQYQYMYILPHGKWHVSNSTYMTSWHCEKAIILKTKPPQKRNIFYHFCNKWYAFMFWKNCIYVISIVNFISVYSVYINLLYITIWTMNTVQRAIKYLCY